MNHHYAFAALPLPLAIVAVCAPANDDLSEVELERMRDEIAVDVEELRDLAFKSAVDVAMRTKAEFVDYVIERSDKVQTAAEREGEGHLAQLFGLIPADMDLEQTMLDFTKEQVGGYYEPSEDTFYVVEGAATGSVLRVVLAHELTHALDDQHFDIDGTLLPLVKTNADAAAAFHAVVEGSGTAIMNRWMAAQIGSGKMSLADVANAGGQEFGDAPAYLWKPLMHSYMRGAAFLVRSDSVMEGQQKSPDTADIDRAFLEPPTSTEQILHPEKYWDAEKFDAPTPVAFELGGLPEGWSAPRQDTMGELGVALLVTPPKSRRSFNPLMTLMTKYTNDAAEGWDGDRYVLLTDGTSKIAHLVSVWDSEVDADEFETSLKEIEAFLVERAKELGDGIGEVRIRRGDGDEVTLTVAAGIAGADVDGVLSTVAVR